METISLIEAAGGEVIFLHCGVFKPVAVLTTAPFKTSRFFCNNDTINYW